MQPGQCMCSCNFAVCLKIITNVESEQIKLDKRGRKWAGGKVGLPNGKAGSVPPRRGY